MSDKERVYQCIKERSLMPLSYNYLSFYASVNKNKVESICEELMRENLIDGAKDNDCISWVWMKVKGLFDEEEQERLQAEAEAEAEARAKYEMQIEEEEGMRREYENQGGYEGE